MTLPIYSDPVKVRGCHGAAQELASVTVEFAQLMGTTVELFIDLADTGDNVFFSSLCLENAEAILAGLTLAVEQARATQARRDARKLGTRRTF